MGRGKLDVPPVISTTQFAVNITLDPGHIPLPRWQPATHHQHADRDTTPLQHDGRLRGASHFLWITIKSSLRDGHPEEEDNNHHTETTETRPSLHVSLVLLSPRLLALIESAICSVELELNNAVKSGTAIFAFRKLSTLAKL